MNEEKQLNEGLVKAMHESLTGFGYRLTMGYVRDEARRLTDPEEKIMGGPSSFIEGFLQKEGLRP